MTESIQIHNAEQIQEQILKAGFKMNVYAKVYFDAMKAGRMPCTSTSSTGSTTTSR